jgi:hypothetical protein
LVIRGINILLKSNQAGSEPVGTSVSLAISKFI